MYVPRPRLEVSVPNSPSRRAPRSAKTVDRQVYAVKTWQREAVWSKVVKSNFCACRMAENSLSASDSGEDTDSVTIDDTELALQGIVMLLNNDWEPAQELFRKHK